MNNKFYKGEITERPKLPKYRKKGGLAGITYPKQALGFDIETGLIRLPLGRQFKKEFDIEAIQISMPTNLKFDRIRELRIIPRNMTLYVENF